jgi:uncharacterized OB-fold protein
LPESDLPLTVDVFYDEARKGRLLGLECELGHVTVPPRRSCRLCNSQNLHILGLSGRGEVISFTGVHVKSEEFPVGTPYVLVLVRLREGGNLLGIFRGSREALRHGAPVAVKFEDPPEGVGKWPRTFFDLV